MDFAAQPGPGLGLFPSLRETSLWISPRGGSRRWCHLRVTSPGVQGGPAGRAGAQPPQGAGRGGSGAPGEHLHPVLGSKLASGLAAKPPTLLPSHSRVLPPGSPGAAPRTPQPPLIYQSPNCARPRALSRLLFSCNSFQRWGRFITITPGPDGFYQQSPPSLPPPASPPGPARTCVGEGAAAGSLFQLGASPESDALALPAALTCFLVLFFFFAPRPCRPLWQVPVRGHLRGGDGEVCVPHGVRALLAARLRHGRQHLRQRVRAPRPGVHAAEEHLGGRPRRLQ